MIKCIKFAHMTSRRQRKTPYFPDGNCTRRRELLFEEEEGGAEGGKTAS